MSNPLHSYATNNGDYDLTSAATIFSETNAGSVTRWVYLDIIVGDLTKGLAGAAETDLTFQISNGGVLSTPFKPDNKVPVGQSRVRLQTTPFAWDNGDTLALTCLSDQAGDTDVDVTVVARDVAPLQPDTSGRTASVDANGIIDAQVKGIDADAITTAAIADDAVTGDKLAASAVLKIWSQLTSGLSAIADSIGKLLVDNVDLKISTRSSFDPATQEVTTDEESRNASKATGFATPLNIADAQVAIINAVNAVNTGAARYISIHTSAAYEIPDSGTEGYPIEIRTFDADGEPAPIDGGANPTVTITRTSDSADLSSNLSAFSSPATAVYRTVLTITEGTDVVGPIEIAASGSIATVNRSTSAFPVVTNSTAVDFTATDRNNLLAILQDTQTTLPEQITNRTLLAAEYATSENQTTIINNIAALPAAVWAIATNTLTTAGTIGKLIVDQFTAVLSAISGIEGSEGTGANTLTITAQDLAGHPLPGVTVRLADGVDPVSRKTASDGTVVITRDNGTVILSATVWGKYLSAASGSGVVYDAETQTATVVITGDASLTLTLTTRVITPSPVTGTTTGVLTTLDDQFAPIAAVSLSYQLIELPAGHTGAVVGQGAAMTVVSNAGGLAELPGLLIGARYTLWSGDPRYARSVVIPDPGEADFVELGSLISP